MPSVATTPGRMETFARALDRAVASAVVPRLRIDELCSAFKASDAQGRSWTIDLESHRWGRLDGERWMAEDPPPQLFMDSELRASLTALEAMTARAVMTGTDALYAPRLCWFRTSASPAEPTTTWASRGSDTTPPPPLDREQAPLAEPARSSESMSSETSVQTEPTSRASVEIKTAPEPALMASVVSSEVPVLAELSRSPVETTPASEPVPMPTVTPTRNSSLVHESAASAASRIAAQAAMPVDNTAPSPPSPLDREQAPLTEPARFSESMSPQASAPRETLPARPAMEDLVAELVRMLSVMSSEVSGRPKPATLTSEGIPSAPKPAPTAPVKWPAGSVQVEPTARASVETTPALESGPTLTVTPTQNSAIASEPEPSVASHVATLVEEPAPWRRAIPEAHRRFAGPGFAPVSDGAGTPASAATAARDATPAPDHKRASAESLASVPLRGASHDHQRWLPTSIAPRLTTVHPEAHDDRAHVLLCGVLATLFFALAVWKGDGRGYAAALLFGLLAVTLLVLNLGQSRDD